MYSSMSVMATCEAPDRANDGSGLTLSTSEKGPIPRVVNAATC
jgi:hypothetical protein